MSERTPYTRWQLLVLGDSNRRITLKRGQTTVGAARTCDIVIAHPTVSRVHGQLTVNDDNVTVEDLGSSNGTRINGRPVASAAQLHNEDAISFGMVDAKVMRVDSERAEAAVELPSASNGNLRAARTEPTVLADAISRFAVSELTVLMEYALTANSVESIAARAYQSLRTCFPELRFEIARRGGGLFAGGLTGDDEPVGEGTMADMVVRSAGPQAARRAAASSLRLVAGVLAMNDQRSTEERPRSCSSKQVQLPEPAFANTAMQDIYDRARKVARSRLSVLIHGETGTGKELLSRFLHGASGREGPFAAINCAALPEDLLEAELFGIRARVATGVDAREGIFVRADKGTLLLDEITEMPESAQAKLLRVLQQGEVMVVGANHPRKVNVRVVATTNRPLDLHHVEGLRDDLTHRLCGWKVTIPPLRERLDDLSALAAHFLAEAAREAGTQPRGISKSALRRMQDYRWPGNVRELQQVMSRAALFVDDGELVTEEHLPEGWDAHEAALNLADASDEECRRQIEKAFVRCKSNATKVAEVLGISRATLYRKMKDLDIKRP